MALETIVLLGVAGLTYFKRNIILNYTQLVEVYGPMVKQLSKMLKVDPDIILAIIFQESGGNRFALGPTRDYGLMQITKGALSDYNRLNNSNVTILDLFQPQMNIKVGAWYYSYLKSHWNLTDLNALKAYNGGIGNLLRGTVSSDAENYSLSVINHFTEIQGVIV